MQMKSKSLRDIQLEVITELLQQKKEQGIIKSDSEYRQEYEAHLAKLDNSLSFMEVRTQEDQTDASKHNEVYYEIEGDIRAIFKRLDTVDETIHKHQRLNQSALNDLKLRIKKIHNRLNRHERLLSAQGTETLYDEAFLDNTRFEQLQTHYTERNGATTPIEYRVKWDAEQEALTLPTIATENTLIGPSGVRLGKIFIRKQLGITAKHQNPMHNVDKAIDADNESFWSEQVLMDAPIAVELGEEYYNHHFGALVELEIQFDYTTTLNELRLHAFCEHPMDIMGVKYFETDDEKEEAKDLIFPNASIPELRSQMIAEHSVFQFPDISVKRIRLILNQRHYVKKEFIASEKEERELLLWFEARQNDGKITMPEYAQNVEEIIQSFKKDERKSVQKYEYQYGLYELKLHRNEYQSTGIYVSEEIPLQGNIKTMTLETNEYHPQHAAPLQLTDIEYYVQDGEKWHPIVPLHQERIGSELLFPVLNQGQYQAVTRFKVNGECVIRKNGLPVEGQAVLAGDQQTILFNEYDPSAYYTVEYQPISDAWKLDFIKLYTEDGVIKPNRMTEEFYGTDNKGQITLRQHPFVDKVLLNAQVENYHPTYLENTYIPIRIRMIDEDGYRLEQSVNRSDSTGQIQNQTNYFQKEQDILEPYSPNDGVIYQYQIQGNIIQFNIELPPGMKIIVEYPYLVSNVRVKAILRRNISGFNGLTPVLYDYTARFQTLV